MIDFLMISTRSTKRGTIEIYPKFIIKKSSDLMIRGGDFYAIWIEERGLWSTDEQDALQLIDRELDKYAKENRHKYDCDVKVLHMWDSDSGMIDHWHKYCQKQMRDSFHMLDEQIIFSNHETVKEDYASKKLNYPLEKGKMPSYEKLMSVLYSEKERQKIEWAIGSVVSGDSKKIQKFLVLYGAAGTGKSTVLNIIQQLFDGYYSVFDAKALGSSSNSFALEAFKTNPLVAIQHDGDLSKIEDNTRLNSLVSHELMTVNEKFKSAYSNRFKAFLFMGTNKPVRITDAKSGLIRRLIDVAPTGEKIPAAEYKKIQSKIPFELGAIAYHCQEVYLQNPGMYDDYTPIAMLGASNDFYNFVIDSYHVFRRNDGTTLKAAWEMYVTYCDEAKVSYPMSQRVFKEELKNYFNDFKDRFNGSDGQRVRSYYSGFKYEKFLDSKEQQTQEKADDSESDWLIFKEQKSVFDDICSECPAQYASDEETPLRKWDRVTTKLKELDTSKLHYAKVPENHIVIDFDIKNASGNKSLEENIKAASKFPPTYAELSKSGQGIHLHYIYSGDVNKLSRVYDDHIEIKVFNGKSSLRRKLSKCNDLSIATISSGLPLKGEKMVNFEVVQSERQIRTQIKKNLNREYHANTKPSIDFIKKILDDAYASDISYDVTDMRNSVLAFAAKSTNHAEYCIKLVNEMKFKSEEPSIDKGFSKEDSPLVFYDVEVFKNLFVVCFKAEGENASPVKMINPPSKDIEDLLKHKLVGFNCRKYDNHILYARLMGYDNMQLYNLSQKIIAGSKNCFFGEAYNISYTDVFDFASVKQSLKKWEIELGIHHQELGLPWDEPVPEELFDKVAEYCVNDVLATEAVFNARQADFTARKILADVAGMTVNDTTNSLTTKIIFGNNRKPQSRFNYRNLGKIDENCGRTTISEEGYFYHEFGDEFTVFDDKQRPVFPGYIFDAGKSTYRGEDVGEGGYVYAEPGMYLNVALLDIASMHPSSIVAENLFGDEYTKRFKELLDIRILIKHKDFEKAKKMLGGALAKYLDDENMALDLSKALKIAINSVYGLTSASFDNPFHDVRNKDNIVAKRGALFMINLKHEVQKRGFTVAHIKTDSIKIPNATTEIIQFVMDYGKMYGYNFEHEATYERMCLVNKSVYIAKYKDGDWTATGDEFQIPYVFKTLFSKEDIKFEDMCETKSVTSDIYLDMNEGLPDVSEYEKIARLRQIIGNGQLSKSEQKLIDEYQSISDDDISEKIANGHNYHYIGKVGSFCPIKPGCGGGILVRKNTNGISKYSAVTGSKGFRWMEAEMVKTLGKEDCIDKSYYNNLVDDAVKDISKYGDFEWFISTDGNKSAFDIKAYDNPPWVLPCNTDIYASCVDCPEFIFDRFHTECSKGFDLPDHVINYITNNPDGIKINNE